MHFMIVDDHLLFTEGLDSLIQRIYPNSIVQRAENATEAMQAISASSTSPDIILLDLNLPGVNGLTLTRKLQNSSVWSPVIIISASESITDARLALEHGALGYLPKSTNLNTLKTAIEQVMQGKRYLPLGWAELIDQNDQEQSPKTFNLTPRQNEILHLMAQGLTNKTIASRLEISENTIKGHLRETFRILQVTNRTSCLNQASRLGLLRE